MPQPKLKEFDFEFFYSSIKDKKWFFLDDPKVKGSMEMADAIARWYIRSGDESRYSLIVMMLATIEMLEEKVHVLTEDNKS